MSQKEKNDIATMWINECSLRKKRTEKKGQSS